MSERFCDLSLTPHAGLRLWIAEGKDPEAYATLFKAGALTGEGNTKDAPRVSMNKINTHLKG